MTETSDSRKDFSKVINDLVSDVLTTFPELKEKMNQDLINPDDEALDRVHQSNMSKLGKDGKPIYREDGKVLKGPDYEPPTLMDLI